MNALTRSVTCLAAALLGLPAAATPLVVDFDYDRPGYYAELLDRGIVTTDPNRDLYGTSGTRAVIGQDGLTDTYSYAARSGFSFDLLGFDAILGANRQDILSCDGAADVIYEGSPVAGCGDSSYLDLSDFVRSGVPGFTFAAPPGPMWEANPDYLRVTGYRGTAIAAEMRFGTGDIPGLDLDEDMDSTLDFAGSGFTGLSRLEIAIDQPYAYPGFVSYDFHYDAYADCRGGCSIFSYDDLALSVNSLAVPLPASGTMAGGAVAMLALLRQGRARSRRS